MSKLPDNLEFELSQLLDGQLSPQREAELRKRLETDPALAEEYSLYQRLEGQLSAIGEQSPQVNWSLQRESIRAALERDALLGVGQRAWPTRLFRWSAGAAAVAAILVAAALLLPILRPGPGGPEGGLVTPGPVGGEPVLLSQVLGPPETNGARIIEVDFRELSSSELGSVPVRPAGVAGRQTGTIVVSGGRTAASSSAAGLLAEILQ